MREGGRKREAVGSEKDKTKVAGQALRCAYICIMLLICRVGGSTDTMVWKGTAEEPVRSEIDRVERDSPVSDVVWRSVGSSA